MSGPTPRLPFLTASEEVWFARALAFPSVCLPCRMVSNQVFCGTPLPVLPLPSNSPRFRLLADK